MENIFYLYMQLSQSFFFNITFAENTRIANRNKKNQGENFKFYLQIYKMWTPQSTMF